MTSASLQTEKPRIWRWEGITLAMLFGLGLLLWPFLSFGAIFVFDSPIQSRGDLSDRTALAYFIWSYPVTYGASLLAYYLLRRFGAGRVMSCLAWGLPIAVYFILPTVVGWQSVDSNLKQVQLLYRTDHVALLAACRDVMTNRTAFIQGSEDIDPKHPKLPAAIVALHPRHISSRNDDSVYLELRSGSDRYGVFAYSEKTASKHTSDTNESYMGEIQLIPGLLLFDIGLTYKDRAEYLNKLRAMKPVDAPTPKW
jgi:hypothetical protein